MSESVLWVPIAGDFGVDLIRGGYTPERIADFAEEMIVAYYERNPHQMRIDFGMRAGEFASKYLGYDGDDLAALGVPAGRPLIWKGVEIAHGSEVRMSYGGVDRFAKVSDGSITDEDGSCSPSEWASKVAGGTSRNAWRDLWFKTPGSRDWVPAQLLRDRAKALTHGPITQLLDDLG